MAGKSPTYSLVPKVDGGTLCQNCSPVNHPGGSESVSNSQRVISAQVKQFATEEEVSAFRKNPFSIQSLGLLVKGLSLYLMEDTTPPEERAKLRLHNISMAASMAVGLGQNTSKALAGDDVPFGEIWKEMPGNALALAGVTLEGALMLRELAAESKGFRAWLAGADLRSLATAEETAGSVSATTRAAAKAYQSRFSETPALKALWQQAAQGLPSTTEGFAQARSRFWRLVNEGTSADAKAVREILKEMKFELQEGTNAPMLKLEGWDPESGMKTWDPRQTREITDRRLTIDHADAQSSGSGANLDPSNLRFMTQRDNSFRGNRFDANDKLLP